MICRYLVRVLTVYSAVVICYETGHDFTVRIDGSHGGLFIIGHQATVSLYVSTEDGSEFALQTFFDHRCLEALWLRFLKKKQKFPVQHAGYGHGLIGI